MINNFLITGQQVLILFIIIGIGFICGKTKLLKESGIKGMTDLVLYAVTPCVIINAFQREFSASMLKGLLISTLIAFLSQIFFVTAATLLIKDSNKKRQDILRFGVVFSNCGYMSLPLQNALLGSDGTFYAAAYIAVFNILMWTYGITLVSNDRSNLSIKKIVFNPGIVGTIAGLFFFFASTTLPEILSVPIENMAALNTPLPMIIIGFYLAKLENCKLIEKPNEILTILLRHIILPVIVMVVIYAAGVRGTLLVSSVISVSAPVATGTTMFATRFDSDIELSVRLASLSTILSIITMTLIVGIAQFLS